MRNKRGLATWQIMLIILMIVVLSIGAYLLISLSKSDTGNVEDDMCRQSNRWRSATTLSFIGEFRPKIFAPKTRICRTQYITIDASDYEKCEMTLDEVGTRYGLEKCAAHQIADLIWRCWYMSGEGAFSKVGCWKCFTGKLVLAQYSSAESAIEVRAALKRQVEEELKCTSVQNRLTKGDLKYCRDLADDIAEKLHKRLTYNALIDFYEDKILEVPSEEQTYTQKIENARGSITTLDNEIEDKLEQNLKDASDYIDFASDIVLEIGIELPDLSPIREDYIKYILKTENRLGRDELYRKSFPSNKLQFIQNYEIAPNNLFEIGFCDPPLEAGAGVFERLECNLFTGQHVELGPGGSVGIGRAGSQYCTSFNALTAISGLDELQKACESLTKS